MSDVHVCNNCNKEFEYTCISGNERLDYDFEGHAKRWVEMNCPFCDEPCVLYGL